LAANSSIPNCGEVEPFEEHPVTARANKARVAMTLSAFTDFFFIGCTSLVVFDLVVIKV
jgi:hypothetical protein